MDAKEKIKEYYTNLNRTKIVRHYPDNEDGIYFSIDEWITLLGPFMMKESLTCYFLIP